MQSSANTTTIPSTSDDIGVIYKLMPYVQCERIYPPPGIKAIRTALNSILSQAGFCSNVTGVINDFLASRLYLNTLRSDKKLTCVKYSIPYFENRCESFNGSKAEDREIIFTSYIDKEIAENSRCDIFNKGNSFTREENILVNSLRAVYSAFNRKGIIAPDTTFIDFMCTNGSLSVEFKDIFTLHENSEYMNCVLKISTKYNLFCGKNPVDLVRFIKFINIEGIFRSLSYHDIKHVIKNGLCIGKYKNQHTTNKVSKLCDINSEGSQVNDQRFIMPDTEDRYERFDLFQMIPFDANTSGNVCETRQCNRAEYTHAHIHSPINNSGAILPKVNLTLLLMLFFTHLLLKILGITSTASSTISNIPAMPQKNKTLQAGVVNLNSFIADPIIVLDEKDMAFLRPYPGGTIRGAETKQTNSTDANKCIAT